MSSSVVISGVGLWTPTHSISNEELVSSYNAWAEHFNLENQVAIKSGDLEAKPLSSADFIEKVSGIKSRYIYSKEGTLDITRMRPILEVRSDEQVSHQAEMAIAAATAARVGMAWGSRA